MKTELNRTGTRNGTFGSAMGVLAGALILGFPAAAHAQVCDPIESAKLIASDGAGYDWYGNAVALSGDTAVIGAIHDDDHGLNSGSAYILTRSEGVWTQQAKLVPSDGAAEDFFGASVAIVGDTVIIGAWGDNGVAFNSGSAYIFSRSGSEWTQQAKLVADDGGWNDQFGSSVSISGDTVVISAPFVDVDGKDPIGDAGAAYIFSRNEGAWTQQAKLQAAEADDDDRFGYAVSISGDTVIIGAYKTDDIGDDSGSAYVFSRSESVWTLQAKLVPADGDEFQEFGYCVCVVGDTAVIGAHRDDDHGTNSGSVYVYTRVGEVWDQQAKLLADDGAVGDEFGTSVSISGSTVVVGASWDDDPVISAGSAYIFARSAGVWTQQTRVLPEVGSAFDHFGGAVAISGDTALIGAHKDNEIDWDSGSVYAFDLGCPICLADLSGDGVLNFIDVSAFLAAFGASDPVADFSGDGAFNFFDVSAFLSTFAAGCP